MGPVGMGMGPVAVSGVCRLRPAVGRGELYL